MGLEVSPITDPAATISRMMEIQFSAFDEEPCHAALCPGGNNPQARAAAGERALQEYHSTPTQTIIQCVDTATGQMIGFAKWNLYDKTRPDEEWRKRAEVDWEPEARKLFEVFWWPTCEMRERLWEGRPHCCWYSRLSSGKHEEGGMLMACCTVCTFLAVHPDHQRRGAGTLLVNWGFEKAKLLGLPAYLEASIAGYPLYLRLGMCVVDTVVVKAEDWGGDHDRRYPGMVKDTWS